MAEVYNPADYFPEDDDLYQTVAAEYLSLTSEDYETAFALTKKCWYVADRYAEIMADAKKMASLHRLNKTEFYGFAYRRYQQMRAAHEHCRAIWRQGKEDVRRAE